MQCLCHEGVNSHKWGADVLLQNRWWALSLLNVGRVSLWFIVVLVLIDIAIDIMI